MKLHQEGRARFCWFFYKYHICKLLSITYFMTVLWKVSVSNEGKWFAPKNRPCYVPGLYFQDIFATIYWCIIIPHIFRDVLKLARGKTYSLTKLFLGHEKNRTPGKVNGHLRTMLLFFRCKKSESRLHKWQWL